MLIRVGFGLGILMISACGDSNPSGGGGPGCGDGNLDAGEECDDANTSAGDGCDGACRFEAPASCGDSIVDYANGEKCDDGNATPGDGCDRCHREAPVTCGDGALDIISSEQCDDGNTTGGDGCTSTCQFEPVGATCANGSMDQGEVCDDANTTNGDACNPTCNFTNTTSIFVGTLNTPGPLDGVGTAAQVGSGTITADATYLWFTDGRFVRRIEVATATVTTIAGGTGAPAYRDDAMGTNARFANVESITTDGTTLWVADTGRIRAITVAPPHSVTTVAGVGPATQYASGTGTAASFDDLRGLTYYAGKVYFVDANAAVLGTFDPTTTVVATLAGTPYTTGCPQIGGTPADGMGAAAVMCSPRYTASDNSGNIFVADTNGNSMRVFNTVTGHMSTFAGTSACGYVDGTGTAAAIHRPRGMTSDGTSLYWVEFNAHTVRQGVIATGAVSTMIGTPPACTMNCSCPQPPPSGGYVEGTGAAARLNAPWSMTYHFPSRSLFVVDGGNSVIRRIQ